MWTGRWRQRPARGLTGASDILVDRYPDRANAQPVDCLPCDRRRQAARQGALARSFQVVRSHGAQGCARRNPSRRDESACQATWHRSDPTARCRYARCRYVCEPSHDDGQLPASGQIKVMPTRRITPELAPMQSRAGGLGTCSRHTVQTGRMSSFFASRPDQPATGSAA